MAFPFELEPLPYPNNALVPVISSHTLDFHHGKHHKNYIVTLNKLIEGTPFASMSLVDIIKATAHKTDKAQVFNNAAQAWNHSFFWKSLSPNGGGKPTGAIAARIDKDLGGYDKFKADLTQAGITQFGSGWAWLVEDQGKLKIVKTSNAETPITGNAKPLLTIDVWEHAYYLDYQNRRADFVASVIDKLLNWDKANERLGG